MIPSLRVPKRNKVSTPAFHLPLVPDNSRARFFLPGQRKISD